MTLLDDRRPSDTGFRMHRRYEITVCGGLGGALQAAELLRDCGLPVRDFSVEVREGVPYSSVFATMSMTVGEAPGFADRMLAHPMILAVDPS
ncbi:MAG: hypothetical protein EKK42_31140 [Pseudonocardiaceae bacterium]|nr:MAG: hypothetical protein EKK42_31140 [Pseudonocardiaceae bacterium]